MYRVLVTGFLSGRNGVSTSMMNLYRHLDKEFVQWDFLMPKDYEKRSRDKSGTFADEIIKAGGRIYYYNYGKYKFSNHAKKYIRELMENNKNIMGVHCHDLGMNIDPLIIADKLNKPIKIVQYHTGIAKSKASEILEKDDLVARKKVEKILGDGFDRWACSDLGGILAYRGYPFEVFPNGVDTKRFSYNEMYRKLIRHKMGIEDDAVVFGFLGTIYGLKNPIFALKVFANYYRKYNKKAYIVFVGGIAMKEENAHNEIIDEARRLHVLNRVWLVGQQLETDMLYSAFDIFLCPSKSEGLPNTLIEAQSTGLPCLISDEITDMAKITPLVESMSLKEPITKWANKARDMIMKRSIRRSYALEIKAAGYDIEDVGRRLTEHYLYRINKWKKENHKKI